LLKTLRIGENGNTVCDAMTLIRCIIRLILGLLVEPGADKPVLIDTLVQHFLTAKKLAETASERNEVSLVAKDLSWLWRTAYNCAVQGCSDWDSEDLISDLFDISREVRL